MSIILILAAVVAAMFDQLYAFVDKVNWNMTFDLNVLLRKNGSWDPSNAIKLLDYIAGKGYQVVGWELGNEPNVIDHLVHLYLPPEQLAHDYARLKNVLMSYKQFKNSVVIGPSVTQLKYHKPIDFFQRYYLNTQSATPDDYVDPAILNSLKTEVAMGVSLTRASGSKAQLWLGETGTAVGPTYDEATVTYRGVFMLLDKFGVSASGGIDVVIWHSFYGWMNSLVDTNSLEPNPVYWVTLMYKTLVGNKVLKMQTPCNMGRLRAYAHCTATKRSGYKAGSVVVYIMNLYDTDRNVTFPDFSPDERGHLFRMEPNQRNLDSRTILLNGVPLKMVNNSTLPDLLQPIRTAASPLTIKSFTINFVVFPHVRITACQSNKKRPGPISIIG